jgi:hypothetical protein
VRRQFRAISFSVAAFYPQRLQNDWLTCGSFRTARVALDDMTRAMGRKKRGGHDSVKATICRIGAVQIGAQPVVAFSMPVR